MSLSSHQKTEGDTDVWLTPQDILAPLGQFNTDPCAAPSPRPWNTAISHIELPENGLEVAWVGRVWLNPPFNRYEAPKWMKRMADHNNGIALIAARTETKMFREYVWGRASSICFLYKRPHFHYPDGGRAKANSGAPIVLIAYGHDNDVILKNCGLGKWLPIK
jgi:hypothetical protein